MPLPTVDEAYAQLQQAPAAGAIQIDVQLRIARPAAAVQAESAQTMARATREAAATVVEASDALRDSVDRFTAASDAGAQELAQFTSQTAAATRGLKWATWCLFAAMVVQVVVMLTRS